MKCEPVVNHMSCFSLVLTGLRTRGFLFLARIVFLYPPSSAAKRFLAPDCFISGVDWLLASNPKARQMQIKMKQKHLLRECTNVM